MAHDGVKGIDKIQQPCYNKVSNEGGKKNGNEVLSVYLRV